VEENGRPGPKLPTGTVGAISELVVCNALMRAGFSVFRSMSPACVCDLIAMRDGELLKIEVTTANRHITEKGRGTWSVPPKPERYDFDLLAAVIGNEIRWYNRLKEQVESPLERPSPQAFEQEIVGSYRMR
jgi:hypothetical protein